MLAFHILIANKLSPPCQHKNNDLEIMMSVMMQISRFSYLLFTFRYFAISFLRLAARAQRHCPGEEELGLKQPTTPQNITRKIFRRDPKILQKIFWTDPPKYNEKNYSTVSPLHITRKLYREVRQN